MKSRRITSRTIRTARQWVKVTRDTGSKTFAFARGYTGEVQAVSKVTYPIKFFTWEYAESFAAGIMADFE